jgi:hypothetical protein
MGHFWLGKPERDEKALYASRNFGNLQLHLSTRRATVRLRPMVSRRIPFLQVLGLSVPKSRKLEAETRKQDLIPSSVESERTQLSRNLADGFFWQSTSDGCGWLSDAMDFFWKGTQKKWPLPITCCLRSIGLLLQPTNTFPFPTIQVDRGRRHPSRPGLRKARPLSRGNNLPPVWHALGPLSCGICPDEQRKPPSTSPAPTMQDDASPSGPRLIALVSSVEPTHDVIVLMKTYFISRMVYRKRAISRNGRRKGSSDGGRVRQ